MAETETKAERLSQLCDEIGYALGRGEMPENQLREFRFLWRTTPDREKDGLSYTLKDIEELVKNLRNEMALTNGANKLQRRPVVFGRPDETVGND